MHRPQDEPTARLFVTEIPETLGGRLPDAVAALAPHERGRILRYRRSEDRYRGLGSALLARKAIACDARCPWHHVQFERTTFGRPYVVAPTDYIGDFNVSHHGRWVGCVVAAGRVGFDIVDRADFSPGLVPAVLSRSEQQFVRSRHRVGDQLRLPAEFWALKEAYVKMLGCGFAQDPAAIELNTDSYRRGRIKLLSKVEDGRREPVFYLLEWATDATMAVCVEREVSHIAATRVEWRALVGFAGAAAPASAARLRGDVVQ